MHNCSYIVPWHKRQSFFSWQNTIHSSISVFKRWIFRGILGTGLWQQLSVNPSNTFYSHSSNFSFLIFALLQSWNNTWVIMALFLSLVSLFRNNNINSLKLVHEIKATYLMLQNFQFKLSEVKINTELLYTILSEHLI